MVILKKFIDHQKKQRIIAAKNIKQTKPCVRKNLFIINAGKSNKTVIMNTKLYEDKMENQLQDHEIYTK